MGNINEEKPASRMSRWKLLKVIVGVGATAAVAGTAVYLIPMLQPNPSPPSKIYSQPACNY